MVDRLLDHDGNLMFSVSYTTRLHRRREIDGEQQMDRDERR